MNVMRFDCLPLCFSRTPTGRFNGPIGCIMCVSRRPCNRRDRSVCVVGPIRGAGGRLGPRGGKMRWSAANMVAERTPTFSARKDGRMTDTIRMSLALAAVLVKP